ncbi:MAG TPA: YbhN family protein, partial [Acidimicrobiales bacterium]|nr:YbhN family protein [Acidimicrobiales bacterium]
MAWPSKHSLRRFWRPFRVVTGFALLGLASWVVAGKSSELSGAGAFLSQPRFLFLALGALAETGSYLSSAFLQRTLLSAGGVHPSRRRVTAIAFATNSIQSALPIGAAFAGLYQFRQYQLLGADEVLAGWVVIASAAVLFVTLAGLAGVGLALSVSTASTFDLVGVVLGVVLATAAVIGLWANRRVFYRSALAAAAALEKRFHLPEGQLCGPLERGLQRVQSVAPRHEHWLRALGWGSATWLTDCACFMFSLVAVGAPVPWEGLLIAYCGGQLAVSLPITPGGLGVVEGTLTVALIAFDPADKPATVAAVLLYRILSFWIPLPIGAVTYGALLRARRRLARQSWQEQGKQRTEGPQTPGPQGAGPGWPEETRLTPKGTAHEPAGLGTGTAPPGPQPVQGAQPA